MRKESAMSPPSDPITFAKRLWDETDDPVLDRWAESFSELIATQALYLARHYARIPEKLRGDYVLFVVNALSSLPDDIDISVSETLKRAVDELKNMGLSEHLTQRLFTT
jgi:hypothetical protein